MSLPKPIGRQKEVLCLPALGHFAVLGTAGSGKTTLAILRAAYLADSGTDHYGKTLLVTFNKALVTYLKHIQDRQLLGNVVIENYHTFARGYLAARNKLSHNEIQSDSDRREALVKQGIKLISQRYDSYPLFKLPVEMFSEELRWMAQHGITTCETYKNVDRVGRAEARIERQDRELVFEIYQTYLKLRSHKYDWDDIATAVCTEFDADNSTRRDRQDEKLIKRSLPKVSILLDREMTTWQAGSGIQYGTYHSAKGLEFDAVILPFCNNSKLPDTEAVAAFGEVGAAIQDGRLLYVGVTRAKTRLIITYSGEITGLLPTNTSLYEKVFL